MPKADGKTPQERFNQRYTIDPVTGCWNWTGGFNGKGYAYLWVPDEPGTQTEKRGRSLQAYKLAYVWKNGPVPEGFELDHQCRNRKCVNPDHVEPRTRQQNQLNSDKTFAAINAAKTECPQGHLYDEENTAVNVNGSRVCRECSRQAAKARYHQTKGGQGAV